MRRRGDDASPRRSLAPAAVVALGFAVVWVVSSLGPDAPRASSPTPTAAATPPSGGIEGVALDGRIVFAANAPDGLPGLRQRLYVFDLESQGLEIGPPIPTAREVEALADGSVLIVADVAGGRQRPSLATSLAPDAAVRTLPAGAIVAASSDGRSLVVVARSRRGCGGEPAYVVRRFRFVLGAPSPIASLEPARCGTPISAAAEDGSTTLAVIDDRGRIDVVIDGVAVEPPLRNAAVLSIGPARTVLLAALDRPIEPTAAPTGPLLVWPFAGAPRPAADGLVVTRFLTWSPDGRRAVVNGVLGGERGMWLVDPARGTATSLLPSTSVELGAVSSGAAFDDAGNVYAGGAGVILAVTSVGTFPLDLPRDAPVPKGPLVWLP